MEEKDDAISRQTVLDATVKKNSIWNKITNSEGENLEEIISQLPPVNPQEPKTGHWIVDSATSSQIGIHGKKTFSYEVHCDKCGWKWAYATDKKDSIPSNYCPHCGAKMTESEDGIF